LINLGKLPSAQPSNRYSPGSGGGQVRTMFIVGSSRSGTSLLRRIFSADPAVGLTSETHFLDQWTPKYPDPSQLWANFQKSPHFTRLDINVRPSLKDHRELFASLLDAKAAILGASIRGDKTPAHFRYIRTLLEWFPEAHVVFAVREPRAVVGSLKALDVKWANGSLIEHIRLWNASADAALRWRSDERVHLVRYEELATQPIRMLAPIWPAITGHDFDPAWLPSGESELYASGSLRTGAITASRVESWRGRLTEHESALVLRGSGHLMRALNYDTDGEPARKSRFAAVAIAEDLHRLARASRHPVHFTRRFAHKLAARS
jgi:hypothetical protein